MKHPPITRRICRNGYGYGKVITGMLTVFTEVKCQIPHRITAQYSFIFIA